MMMAPLPYFYLIYLVRFGRSATSMSLCPDYVRFHRPPVLPVLYATMVDIPLTIPLPFSRPQFLVKSCEKSHHEKPLIIVRFRKNWKRTLAFTERIIVKKKTSNNKEGNRER